MDAVLREAAAEQLLAVVLLGQRDVELAVEPAHEGGIEHAAAVAVDIIVGRGQHEDGALFVHDEAVHLREQLVERVLAVEAADAAGADSGDRVHLVDEDHGRGVAAGLLEDFLNIPFGLADDAAEEGRRGDRDKHGVGLVGHGLGEHGLAGARRAVEQHALRNPLA